MAGLKIGAEDYTVKSVVARTLEGERYYDQRLTEIEKSDLLSVATRMTSPGSESSALSDIEDKRLLRILQGENWLSLKERGRKNNFYTHELIEIEIPSTCLRGGDNPLTRKAPEIRSNSPPHPERGQSRRPNLVEPFLNI